MELQLHSTQNLMNSESQKTDAEEYIVYDSIYTKSQSGKINSVKNQQTHYPGRRG